MLPLSPAAASLRTPVTTGAHGLPASTICYCCY